MAAWLAQTDGAGTMPAGVGRLAAATLASAVCSTVGRLAREFIDLMIGLCITMSGILWDRNRAVAQRMRARTLIVLWSADPRRVISGTSLPGQAMLRSAAVE